MSKKQCGPHKPFIAYRSFYTQLNTIEKFSKTGYDTICIFPAHTVNSRGTPYSQYPPVWTWYDQLDFSVLDRIFDDVGKAMPDASYLCMIDLNAPIWLEHIKYYSCCDSFNNLGKAVHNPDWREPTEKFLTAFLDYTESRYGDRIKAYILACGATDEWYDYSNGTDDSHRRAAWRRWRSARNLPDPVDIPPESIRTHLSHDDFLRDPEYDKNAIDYWKFCNESIAETILDFAAVTRSRIRPETQIGCFYGYILEKAIRTLVSCGHLEYEKVLASPDIDFLISPGTYTDRQIGGGSGFLIPHGTASVHRKRLLHECDQRTHTYNPYLSADITLRTPSAWPDEKSTVAGLKREAALGLINRTNLWWFDMWGDFYQGEAVMNTLAQIRKLWDQFGGISCRNRSEIALIVDPQSTYYIGENHPRATQVHLRLRNTMNRLGAPFEVYSFNDIPLIADLNQYKLLIFNSTFELTPEKLAMLERFAFKSNRSVLWLYAPGVIRDGVFAWENCEKLTGIPYATVGVESKDMGDWISYYIHDYAAVTPEILRCIAGKAMIHLYTEEELPVYAEGDLLAIHTESGGTKKISTLPGYTLATELFTEKSYPITAQNFIYDFSTPDTALFKFSQPKGKHDETAQIYTD